MKATNTNTWGYWNLTPSNNMEWKKKKLKKQYLRRAIKLLETKLYSRNIVKVINTCAVPFVKYSGLFLKWTRKELKQMDQRKRKLMTMLKVCSRDNVDSLYVSRRKGGWGLASIEDSVDASIERLKEYMQKSGGRLIAATRNNTNNMRTIRTT